MLGEIFGPILPILSYVQIETAIDRINQVTNPLFLSIFTRNRQLATKCYSECAFGGGCVNDVANYRLPFGRVGDSGIGRYHDRHIIEEFSHQKPITNRGGWLDMPIRHPPFDRPYSWP